MNDNFNPYQSSDTSAPSLAKQLISEQNAIGTMLGALAGGVPGFLIFVLLYMIDSFTYLGFILPGIMAGLFARFMGRGIERKHRFVAAAVTFVLVLLLHLFLPFNATTFWLSMINVVLAFALAVRRLNRQQSDALFEYQIGIKPFNQPE